MPCGSLILCLSDLSFPARSLADHVHTYTFVCLFFHLLIVPLVSAKHVWSFSLCAALLTLIGKYICLHFFCHIGLILISFFSAMPMLTCPNHPPRLSGGDSRPAKIKQQKLYSSSTSREPTELGDDHPSEEFLTIDGPNTSIGKVIQSCPNQAVRGVINSGRPKLM